MKTASDPRHLKRIELFKKLYSYSFRSKNTKTSLRPIVANLAKIDPIIVKCAPEWPIAKLNRVDLAILRLAINELMDKKTPQKVIIDEAIELAKKFGTENTPKFVNGVLGTAINHV